MTDLALSGSHCGYHTLALSGHFYYFDMMTPLRKLIPNAKGPIWFTVVRDPVEAIISRYYFTRQPKHQTHRLNKQNMKPEEFNKWLNTTFDECLFKKQRECRFFPTLRVIVLFMKT